jgi:nitrogen regulatory protein PII
MAAFVSTETTRAWSSHPAVEQITGGPGVHGSDQIKKVEITMPPNAFEDVRPSLQGLSLSEVAVSEIRICGQPGSRKGCYRGVQYDALIPRVRIELLVQADHVAELFTMLSQRLPIVSDGVPATVLISNIAEATQVSALQTQKEYLALRQTVRSL